MKKIVLTIVAAYIMAMGAMAQENIRMMVIKHISGMEYKVTTDIVKEILFVEGDDIHKYVDLALPSGTLWATHNVGASKPEEYGYYFAWGETMPKENYTWGTYKWCNGSLNSLTKYCSDSKFGSNGFTDDKIDLDIEDDAAYANWGGNWRMPSKEQQEELREKCTWRLVTQNGVKGYSITGSNGNSIFLPVAGYRDGTSLRDAGSDGHYWLNSLFTKNPISAYRMYLGSLVDSNGTGNRYYGRNVRPVRMKE